jgi:hypothetical protein
VHQSLYKNIRKRKRKRKTISDGHPQFNAIQPPQIKESQKNKLKKHAGYSQKKQIHTYHIKLQKMKDKKRP